MKLNKRDLIKVLIIFLLLPCNVQAGIKGGKLTIKNVTAVVYENMNRKDGLIKSVFETLTLTENSKFACLHIEVMIDWSDNDKATEHTIQKNQIKLFDRNSNEFSIIGRHAGNGDLVESISSHIHLQRNDISRYFSDLIFAIPADLKTCTLQIEESQFKISLPEQIIKPHYEPVAMFRISGTTWLEQFTGGRLPGSQGPFESVIKPIRGRILEVTLEIEPLASTAQRDALEGFYDDRKIFSFESSDVGIFVDDNLYFDSIAAESNDMVYHRVGNHQSFREKWKTITKNVYFCVPPDIKYFNITYEKHLVAEGQVPE